MIQLSRIYFLYIVDIDQNLLCNSYTLQEMILQIQRKNKSKLFIGVEKKSNNQGFVIYYPVVYKKEALKYTKCPPFYSV